MIFSIFTALCNHRHNLISEHFHHLKKKPHPNKETVCPIPLPASRWQQRSTSEFVYFTHFHVTVFAVVHLPV